MSAAHLKGPWEYVPKLTASENHKGFFVRAEKPSGDGKWTLAEVQPGDVNGELGEANARLIAAAPALLEALRNLDECYCEVNDEMSRAQRAHHRSVLMAARAAIAAATGAAS